MQLSWPTFKNPNCTVLQVDSMKHTLAKYLLELSIMDYQLVHYHPSEVSAACLCLAVKLLDDDDCTWDETLEFYSTYSEQHLQPIMNRLALLVHKSSSDKQQVGLLNDVIMISVHACKLKTGQYL